MTSRGNPILFTTDFHAHSEAAFAYAVSLAKASDAPVIVLHVCNMPDMPQILCEGRTYHETLKAQLDDIDSPHVEIRRVFQVADPAPEICRIAKELACQMIVMGITHKCGSDLHVSGDVHGYIEKNSNCPLVTLYQPCVHHVAAEPLTVV